MKKISRFHQKLAYYGGEPTIKTPFPHDPWPPQADNNELQDLMAQRQDDIRVTGNSGPIIKLEENFLAFLNHQVKYAIAFNSGTTGLLAAYFSIGIQSGDEVIVPALTYHAAVSPLFILRAKPVLIDVDYGTRCINADLIEAAITAKTKAITVVHQWGHPADMNKICLIAKKYNLKLIEDCSHAHGSQYHNKLCGTFGDVAVFSLQANKTIYAGEGGILVTNNQLYYERAILLGHNRDRAYQDVKSDLHRYWVTGFGLKLRISPFNAIIATHALAHFPMRKQQRHQCLNYFLKQLKKINYLHLESPASYVEMGAWYGFKPNYIQDKLGIDRDLLITILRAEGLDINNPSGKPLYMLPLFYEKNDEMFFDSVSKKIPQAQNYPVANFLDSYGLSFPTFSNWPQDKNLIDAYILGLQKVGKYFGVK